MKLIFSLYLLFLAPVLVVAQHSIKATFSPAEHFNWALLYKLTPDSKNYVAQSKIIEGKVEFQLDSSETKGIYILVYAAPQDEYNFNIIYNGEEDIELTFNVTTGVVFQKSSENILLNSYINAQASKMEEIEEIYMSNTPDSLKLLSLFQDQRSIQKEYEDRANNSLAYPFIRANKPYIPMNYEDPETYVNNNTLNYFTNIDFENKILQSSNFLLDRSFAYIMGVMHTEKDKISSYNLNIDEIILLLADTDSKYQKAFLNKLWQKLVNYKTSESANYLATKYLIDLALELNDELLVEKITAFKKFSIGSIAPDFSWEIEAEGNNTTQKLSELAIAENYILVFWSSSCAHCLEEIPKLNLYTKSLDKIKYKVIAVGLEENSMKWDKETAKFPDFINVLKLNKWENEIVKTYNLVSTPTYFVLDKDKRFLAKPKDFEDLKLFLEK